jgi:ribonuclease P protein component
MASFRVHYLFGADGTFPIRFGAGVSNKNFKKAVDRNRIKRLAKEAWRQQKSALQQRLKEKNEGMDIFFIYTGKEVPEFKIVYDAIGKAINKLSGMIDPKQ